MLKIIMDINNIYGIDVIHVIKIMFISTFFAAFFAKKILRKPLIVSIHGSNQYIPNTLLGVLIRIYKKTLARITLKFADKVVVITPSLSSVALSMGVPSAKIESIAIVPNLQKFYPRNMRASRRKLDLPMEKFIILYIGSFRSIKGIQYLVEAAKNLLEKNIDLFFIFCGEGPLIKKLLKHMSTSTKDNIMLPGYVSNTDEYIAAANVLVLPSLSEGLPMVVQEAQAMGKPVIVTNVGGVSDIIKNEETGLIIEPMDINAIENAITMLLNDKELQEKMGNEGRKNIEKKFNSKIISKKIEKMYFSIMNPTCAKK
jgi:glycosyltransferase involved in cell wall biosynthesis